MIGLLATRHTNDVLKARDEARDILKARDEELQLLMDHIADLDADRERVEEENRRVEPPERR